jgi:hypothetical protein
MEQSNMCQGNNGCCSKLFVVSRAYVIHRFRRSLSAAEQQPKKDVVGTGQYRFAVASGEFRNAENLMILETHPTLPRIGTDLFQHYSEWQDILSEETLSEKQDLKNLLRRDEMNLQTSQIPPIHYARQTKMPQSQLTGGYRRSKSGWPCSSWRSGSCLVQVGSLKPASHALLIAFRPSSNMFISQKAQALL